MKLTNVGRSLLNAAILCAITWLASILNRGDVAAAADKPAPQAVTSEQQADLDAFVKDYNDLFPASGVSLTTVYTRSWIPGQTWKQVQKFDGKLVKTSQGAYEQHGSIESENTLNGQVRSRATQQAVTQLRIDRGQVVLYAIYTDQNGTSSTYGPSGIDRSGNSIAFRDTTLGATEWESSTFFRKRDGTLGSTRHWKFPVGDNIDTWQASYPAAAETAR